MKKAFAAACLAGLILVGCTASQRISRIKEHQSPDHKAIHDFLAENKKRYNRREMIDPSRLTREARINTQYHEEDDFLSPRQIQKAWPSKKDVIRSHAFRLQSIEVESISVTKDTARVQTRRTLVSKRWNTRHRYTFSEVYKKRNGVWKLHRCRTQPRTCTACH